MPTIHGDRMRLLTVFQNLLESAAKFIGDQDRPWIEIGEETGKGEGVSIYVRDNGIGIDPRYQERVFRIFERLDPQIEGTGIGLALCRRILEFHGGRLWAESLGLGQGSTFHLVLPPPDSAQHSWVPADPEPTPHRRPDGSESRRRAYPSR